MPQLSNLQKCVSITRLRDGVSIRAIAREINVNKNTVLLAKPKFEETETIRRKQGTGRKNVSQGNDDALLVNFLRENPIATAIQAKIATNFPGSTRTARKRIRQTELRNRSAANKIVMTLANKRERLHFAHQYLNGDNFWATVIFSNEKTFQSCSNGRVRVYRPIRERFVEQYVHQINRSGRFSVNVWGWISLKGLGVCIVIEDRLTAVVYRDILQNAMLASVTQVFGNNFTFQHDNCPIHTAHIIRDFLEVNNVPTLNWPSRSPDMNPIENISGIMAKEINDRVLPQNREELVQSIANTWHQIPREYVEEVVLSMPRRLQKVIDADGAQIKY
jgi:transposase